MVEDLMDRRPGLHFHINRQPSLRRSLEEGCRLVTNTLERYAVDRLDELDDMLPEDGRLVVPSHRHCLFDRECRRFGEVRRAEDAPDVHLDDERRKRDTSEAPRRISCSCSADHQVAMR